LLSLLKGADLKYFAQGGQEPFPSVD
jgi:hypothetical protein